MTWHTKQPALARTTEAQQNKQNKRNNTHCRLNHAAHGNRTNRGMHTPVSVQITLSLNSDTQTTGHSQPMTAEGVISELQGHTTL